MSKRIAWIVIALFVAAAIFADFIANDRPIASSVDGELTLFANVVGVGAAGAELSDSLGEGDWALWPPSRFGPISVRTGTRILVLAPPSEVHWLGTDDRGRDVFARLVHGARSTLALAGWVAIFSITAGVCIALLGSAGRRSLRTAVRVVTDAASGTPIVLLVVAFAGLWGGGSVALAVVTISIPRAADAARVALDAIEDALAQPYAEAARAFGLSRARLLVRHALPNAAPALRVAAALTASLAVLAEAALSFLGFGVQPPEPSWGELFAQAHQNGLAWWLLVPAGACAAALAGAFAALARHSP